MPSFFDNGPGNSSAAPGGPNGLPPQAINAIGNQPPEAASALIRALSARGQISAALAEMLRRRHAAGYNPESMPGNYQQSIGLGVD